MNRRSKRWLMAVVEILCLLVYVITFTFYRPMLDFKLYQRLARYPTNDGKNRGL